MELKPILEKGKLLLKSHRYVVIILLIGFALMLLPIGKKTPEKSSTIVTQKVSADIQKQLVETLQKIDGVGEVHLLLTVDSSGETIYQTDLDTSTNESAQSNRTETVIVTDANRNQSGLIRKSTEPNYRGAVVICKGGANPQVQLAVTQAVMKSTGLSADQICVLKMK